MNRRIDEVPVSDRLEDAVSIGMKKVTVIHRRRVLKKSLAAAASLVIALTAFFTWGFSNPVLASQLPWIGHIFAQNEKNISFPGDYASKAEALDTEPAETSTETVPDSYSVSDSGYTFTANEVYSDGSSIYFGLTVKKETGFGHVPEFPTERFGKTNAQAITVFWASATIYSENNIENPIQIITTNSEIEGNQIDETTFEGILKIDLADNILPPNEKLTADLDIEVIYCIDDSTSPESHDNHDGNWKIPSIPFTVDGTNVRIYEINDINSDGFGLGTVIVTPYEVKVETILPPLYSSKEELLNYGSALFDASGNALEFQNETDSADGKSIITTYSVKDTDTSTLYFYIGEGDHESIKETDQTAMDARALYKYQLHTTP